LTTMIPASFTRPVDTVARAPVPARRQVLPKPAGFAGRQALR
jgi:hypothetical protein